jgi:hypothetical protein
MIDPADYYGTLSDANDYFEDRLHETDWGNHSDTRKEQALLAATRDVDALVYAGYKTTVFDLLESNPDATEEEIAAADAAQALKFPRDGSDTTPAEIEVATYEIAHERLRGRDPAIEIENLRITTQGSGPSSLTFATSQLPPVHIENGIVSWVAWRYLQPFLAKISSFSVFRR